MYDPVLGRMLSPDNYVQAPGYTQSFNRYAYCWNNPLKFTDPSGDFIFTLAALLIPGGQAFLPVALMADFGGIVNTATHWNRIATADGFKWGNLAAAYGVGALGGIAMYYGAGTPGLGAIPAMISSGGAYLSGTAVTSIGNNIFFGDPMPTGEQVLMGMAMSVVPSGVIGGLAAKSAGLNFWTGKAIPKPIANIPSLSSIKVEQAKAEVIVPNPKARIETAYDDVLPRQGDISRSQLNADGMPIWSGATKGGAEGGLNLFKFGSKEATSSAGWKSGDRFLKMYDQGSPKLNWKQNSGFLRSEMNLGKPIFDSYRLPNGNLIPTGGFLNAERNLLQSRGWFYNSGQGAWLPPIR